MGNKAAYIHLRGSDLRPQFHQFTAVVSPPSLGRKESHSPGRWGLVFYLWGSKSQPRCGPVSVSDPVPLVSQPHPDVKPMALRQHAAAVRDDVRPTWQGPAPHRPQARPRAALDPLLLCKVCIYSPLGLQRGWGAGQMVCSPTRRGGEAKWRRPGHSGGRPAQPWGGGAQKRLPALLTCMAPPAKAIGPHHRKTPGRRVSSGRPHLHPLLAAPGWGLAERTPSPAILCL